MIIKELKKIGQNKLLLATVIVVSCIPILYASVFLKSIWDPYGKTKNLPVAVVNNDQAVDYNGKTLSVGADLVDNLKKNTDLKWSFVSEAEAQKGLKNKEYYMVIKLPEDFSEDAASVMDAKPTKMKIDYETNGALNYLGEVISESAVKEIKSQVSSNVTQAYADAISESLVTMGDGMTEATDGSQKIYDGATQLADGSDTLTVNLNKLASSTLTFKNGADTLTLGLEKYVTGVNTINEAVTQLGQGMNLLAAKLPALSSGVNQLASGSNALGEGIHDYTGGVDQIQYGLQALCSKNSMLKAGTDKLGEVVTSIGKLQYGITSLQSGLNSLNTLVSNSKSISDNYIATLSVANTEIAAINPSDVSASVTQLNALSGEITTAIDAIEAVQNQIDTENANTISAVQSTAAYQNMTPENQQEIDSALSTANSTASINLAQSLTNINSQLQNINSQITNSMTLVQTESETANAQTTALQTALSTITAPDNTSLTQASGLLSTKLVPLANGLASGSTELQTQAGAGVSALTSGLNQYLPTVEQISTGASYLSSKSDTLISGAGKMTTNLQTLSQSIPGLTAGVNQLTDGMGKVSVGTTELSTKGSQLTNGAMQLNSGAAQIADGSNKLADGSSLINSNLVLLSEGSNTLYTSLNDGATKVKNNELSTDNTKMISSPIALVQEKYSDVPNYGHALAPYFLSVSLFVGCLVFNFVYPIRKKADKEGSATAWFFSKIAIGGIVATLMAVITGSVMLLIGLHVSHPLQYFGILLVTAYSFMFIIMGLAMAFDNPGRFVAMLLLVVQLGAAGGTFPMQLTGAFYNVVHSLMPMTYAIYGLRQAISSGLGTETFLNSFMVLFVIAAAFIGFLFLAMQVLYKKHKNDYSQLHHNQTLLSDDYSYDNKNYALW